MKRDSCAKQRGVCRQAAWRQQGWRAKQIPIRHRVVSCRVGGPHSGAIMAAMTVNVLFYFNYVYSSADNDDDVAVELGSRRRHDRNVYLQMRARTCAAQEVQNADQAGDIKVRQRDGRNECVCTECAKEVAEGCRAYGIRRHIIKCF
jgi:hypothetical protein